MHRPSVRRPRVVAGVSLAAVPLLAGPLFAAVSSPQAPGAARSAASASFSTPYAYVNQLACSGVGQAATGAGYSFGSCGYVPITISGAATGETFEAHVFSAAGDQTAVVPMSASTTTAGSYTLPLRPVAAWTAGYLPIKVYSVGRPDPVGQMVLPVDALTASLDVALPEGRGAFTPTDPITVTGTVAELGLDTTGGVTTGAPATKPVAATYSLRVTAPDGAEVGLFGPFTAPADGAVSQALPTAQLFSKVPLDASNNYFSQLGVKAVDLGYSDAGAAWAAATTGSAALPVSNPPDALAFDASFVSPDGWVKPGKTYPFRLLAKNFTSTAKSGGTVTYTVPDGAVIVDAVADDPSGAVTHDATTLTWHVADVPAGAGTAPSSQGLTITARAKSTTEDAQIVWKDLSATASLVGGGNPTPVSASTHGPKVIPPDGSYDSARYGDRPFPIITVDYQDRKHDAANTGKAVERAVSGRDNASSTFSLYQEMSLGQLYVNGVVPSANFADAGWDVPGYDFAGRFTTLQTGQTCHGVTFASTLGTPLQDQVLPERISGGWYQLPGNTDYYGDDANGSALVGAVAGNAVLQAIDSGCGSAAKTAYDAAVISDPDIDYNQFDTDKDGVVDFFVALYTGLGGNGVSQTSVPPYDNVWPHSSSLESSYKDADGQKGYVTNDQLTDLAGRKLFWTDATRSVKTTTPTDFKVFVRVGPYNMDPEGSATQNSVVGHEYGHALGLPDYYSTGTRETYGSWSIMAADHAHNSTVNEKQELGWIVPQVLEPGTTTVAKGFADSKKDTHSITWQTPDGAPYTLTGPTVHNAEAYVAKLPSKRIIDPALVPSGSKLLWSGSGNGFGCGPQQGHNIDISLPELADVPAGTKTTLDFKSLWQIEWDYDYGFVLATTDNGDSYTGIASGEGYSTAASTDPNQTACLQQYGQGLTGTAASYTAGTQEIDRKGVGDTAGVGSSYPTGPFVDDSYDITSLAGTKNAVVRLEYFTDAGLAKDGWFIDDLSVTAGGTKIVTDDFEDASQDFRFYNGGCRDGIKTGQFCTQGWQVVDAAAGSTADHAYYVEMRDRSGFDAAGKQQSESGGPTFTPGLAILYTDEAHAYGNFGTADPPAQTIVDQRPTAGSDTPNLDDAALQKGETYDDTDHVDNYTDAASEDGNWHFAYSCLTATVDDLAGTDVGPEDITTGQGGNLAGDVTLTTGEGCAEFSYAYGAALANVAPVVSLQAKSYQAAVGETVTLTGSGTTDDHDAAGALGYAWTFGDGATATGSDVSHAWTTVGAYPVSLTVTDLEGLSTTKTVTVVVTATGAGSGRPAVTADQPVGTVTGSPGLASTGLAGGVAVLAVLTLAGGLGLARYRRDV